MAWIAADIFASGLLGLGDLVATCAAALLAQGVLARATVDADRTGYARAALRHLATLRIPRTRHNATQRPAMASPDLRAPMAAAWLAAAASLTGLVGASSYWNLPELEMTRGLFANHQNAPINTSPAPFAGAAHLRLPPRKEQS